MIKVAFICVHNFCRSQIAEAMGRIYGKGVFESYSAGTEVKETINPTVVRLMKEVYGLNLLEKQYPKLLEDLPSVDIVVTMGCNVACPYLPCKEKINWHIEDPTGKDDKFYLKIMDEIKMQVLELKDYLREI